MPEDKRQAVNGLMSEVNQLEQQLQQEASRPAGAAERTRQGDAVTRWWDDVNGWLRRHF